MIDREIFKDAESVRIGQSHVTSQRFSHFRDPDGMLRSSLGMPSRKDGPPSIRDTHGKSGNVFADPTASSTTLHPQELNPWSSGRENQIHSSTAEKNENQTRVQDQRYHSGPSARNSFLPSEERCSKNDGTDQQRLQISDLHFDKFPTPATFTCWKISFKTEVGRWISSQWKFPRYQSTNVIPCTSDTWRDVATFFRIAEPQRRTAMHLGHTWYIGKRFCKSTCSFISSLSSRIESMGDNHWGAAPYVYSGEKWKTRTKSRCQSGPSAKDSVIFSGGDFSTNFGADQQRLQVSDLHFDKFTMSATFACRKTRFKTEACNLLTISYRSYDVDQRSGVGWFSGWSQIFAFYQRNSWTRLRGTRRENCFSSEQNHPEFLIPKKNQSGGTTKPKKRTVCFAVGRLLTWSTINSGSLEPTILSRIMPTYSLLVFEMTMFRNSIQSGVEFYNLWQNPIWWYLGRVVQN